MTLQPWNTQQYGNVSSPNREGVNIETTNKRVKVNLDTRKYYMKKKAKRINKPFELKKNKNGTIEDLGRAILANRER